MDHVELRRQLEDVRRKVRRDVDVQRLRITDLEAERAARLAVIEVHQFDLGMLEQQLRGLR